MIFVSRYSLIAGFLGMLAQPVMAQDNPALRSEIDLDGKAPEEILQAWHGGKRILFWSEQDRAWIELFHGATVTGLVDDPRSYFKRIVSDGRQWQWRNVGFVPLVADPAVAAGQASDDDFRTAIAPFQAELAEAPENSVANMLYLFKKRHGADLRAIRLATTVLCSEGGSICPLVVFRDGAAPLTVSFSLDAPWGFFENGRRVYVEYQHENELIQVDLASGAQTKLEMIVPQRAEAQIREPRRYAE